MTELRKTITLAELKNCTNAARITVEQYHNGRILTLQVGHELTTQPKYMTETLCGFLDYDGLGEVTHLRWPDSTVFKKSGKNRYTAKLSITLDHIDGSKTNLEDRVEIVLMEVDGDSNIVSLKKDQNPKIAE